MRTRFFRAPLGALSAVALAVVATACGGDSDDDAAAESTVITGTVAIGAAVPGAAVTVKDADGASADVTGTADAQGAYSLDVSSLTPPLVVTAAGTLNGETVSIVAIVPALAAGVDNIANVTSLTNAVAALVAPGGDLNALASASAIAAINPAAAANASALVVNTLKTNPEFATLLGANFDPLTTPFTANGTGIDAVVDQVQVEAGTSGVSITNLSAPSGESGQATVTLTPAQVSTPTVVPTLPASAPPSELPTAAELAALAKKFEDCLALPLASRVTLDSNNEATAVSPACTFGPAQWKSDGGNWVERVGTNTLRFDFLTGSRAGAPTLATVLAPPNFSGTTFQHPYCNSQTCVVMTIPMTTASGKPWVSGWQLGKIDGQWNFVGNQLPYALGVEHRLNRKQAVNTALASANPSTYSLQDRFEASLRVIFNPDASGAAATNNIRAVVWKGPGLPVAGLVTHRSQRCATDDRFGITNQEGLLTVNNSSTVQYWTGNSGTEFFLDAAKLDGSGLALSVPSANWSTNAAPANQDFRAAPFTGSIPAWSNYTAEIYYFTNTGNTPDEVIVVRNATPFEPAAAGAAKSWPVLASASVDQYLKPTGASAGSLTNVAQTLSWTNPSNGYVSFANLFSTNRVSATNSEGETAFYIKRSSIYLRPAAYGDATAVGSEWGANQAGTALSSYTASTGTNPNPRCTSDEVLPLDADNTNRSYREVGLQSRGPDRKLYNAITFWSN